MFRLTCNDYHKYTRQNHSKIPPGYPGTRICHNNWRHKYDYNHPSHQSLSWLTSVHQIAGKITTHHHNQAYDKNWIWMYAYAIRNQQQHSRNVLLLYQSSGSIYPQVLKHAQSDPHSSYPEYHPSVNDSRACHLPHLSYNSIDPEQHTSLHTANFWSHYASVHTDNRQKISTHPIWLHQVPLLLVTRTYRFYCLPDQFHLTR